jgi:hypothetical protein
MSDDATVDAPQEFRGEGVSPPPGSLGEAINVFFDRAEEMLPTWIGKKWAYIISMLIALLVLLIAFKPIKDMRDSAETPLENIQWIGTLMISLIVVILLQNSLCDMIYSVMMVSANKQHIANTHWLGEYSKALRTTGSLLLKTSV